MLTKARHDEMVDILHKTGKLVVKELSEKFGVSEDCIRKDLRKLESLGCLQRTYGGAILPKDHCDISMDSYDQKYKKIVAKKAFDILKDNEVIFLDISTINIYLAELIADSGLSLTIVTNMFDIIKVLEKAENIKLICPGGVFDFDKYGFVGSETIKNLENYRFHKAFIGVGGADIKNKEATVMETDDANTKMAVIKRSRESYLVMNNYKFDHTGNFKYVSFNEVNGIITEGSPKDDIKKTLLQEAIPLL